MSYLINLLNPSIDAIKRPPVGNVIDQDHTLGRSHKGQNSEEHRGKLGPETHRDKTNYFIKIKTVSCIDEAGLELTETHLPLSPKHWVESHILLCLVLN